MAKRSLTTYTVSQGHLERLRDLDCQLTALRALMMEAGDQDHYAAVLSLIEPVIHELQVVTGEMYDFKPHPNFELKQGGAA